MSSDSSEQKASPTLFRQAESAWMAGDLTTSTKALAAKAGITSSFVQESLFQSSALASGMTAEPLTFNGRSLSSSLVRIENGVAVFDIGVPLLADGTFYSQAFAHLKYPERYGHLFGNQAGEALKTAAKSPYHIADAYITLVRPPFYHWLLDTVPHLYAASRLGHLSQVKLLAPDSMTFQPWQRALLEKAAAAFGINNLAYLPTNGTVVAVRPGYSQTRLPLKERLSLLRLIAPPPSTPSRLLYSRRGKQDNRQLLNEDAIITALGDRFTVIDPGDLDLDTQMALFSEARCVVGVHGSNLANIAFCQPGTTVVEIAAGLPQPHFEKLAKAADLRFERVKAEPVAGPADRETWVQAHGDLTVDSAAVAEAVEAALGSATTP